MRYFEPWLLSWFDINLKRFAHRKTRWKPAVMTARFSITALILLASFAKSCDNPKPKAPPPPGSWLVLLCKAADDSGEPHPKSFYEELFSKDKRDLLFDYFKAVSNETVDVSGTEVYGWFPMMVKAADISARNNGTQVKRDQTARDCKASALGGIVATGISIDPQNYAGVITVINVPVDWGDTGEHSVVLPADIELSAIEHEMLHAGYIGPQHSWAASRDTSDDHVWANARSKDNGDVEYGDCWDIMSYIGCTYMFATLTTPDRGRQGPELEAAYRQKAKWLPGDRVQNVVGRTTQVTLAPLSDPSKPGSLLAKIDIPRNNYYVTYVVEYRERSRFDRGIPNNAVVIREQRGNGMNIVTYLVQRRDGSVAWRKGDIFTDTGNYLRISVDDIVPGAATVTINTAYSTTLPQVGDWCGDKYRDQVLTCPSGTQCIPRRAGEIQTTDYFCQ